MPTEEKPNPYAAAGVNYGPLDAAKRLAQSLARDTSHHLQRTGGQEMEESRGESAYVWQEGSEYRAMVMEGLGTKNLVADAMRIVTGKTYYANVAQDTVAAIVNDLIVVGANPQVITPYWAVGSSDWFEDNERAGDLANGWRQACDMAGVTWGGGETPTLKGIVSPETIDLGGAAIGTIQQPEYLVLGDKLGSGDAILFVESNGVHANGLTLIRSIAENLPNGFATPMENSVLFGEAVLQPAHIYAALVRALQANGVDIHYMVNVTGHGWRKIMRSDKSFSYIINQIPDPQEVFKFIQQHGNLSDEDMYATFNMGAGFAIFVSAEQAERVIQLGQEQGLQILHAGEVQKGNRQVVIKPKGITFSSETLEVR